MAYVGLLLFIVGGAGMFLAFSGVGLSVPGFTKLGLDFPHYVVVALVGAFILMMTRRPGD